MTGGFAYHFDWNVIWRNADRYIDGAGIGLALTVGCVGAGIVIGVISALAATSESRLLRGIAGAYVEFIRNVPILLLTYFAYYGLPRLGIRFLDNVESFVLVLSLYAGAFFSEVFRSGIQAIPHGFLDAGKALGLTRSQRVLTIQLPIMLRIVLPALSNGVISVFKDTSVGFAIAIPELTGAAMWVNVNTFHVIESWLTAALIYLCLSYLIAAGMRGLERYLTVGW